MPELLSRDDWRRLERLVLSSRSAASSPAPGRRTGTHRGYSVEFHDYRRYEPGDDPRDIDWTIYGRLDRLFLRLFRAESELTAHLLVDTSASMGIGTPSKLACASKVAVAIAYVVAANQERVGLATFADGLQRLMEPRRGRAQAGRILRALAEAQPRGRSNLTGSLRQYAGLPHRRGLAVVITDALAPDGVEHGLAYLAYRGFEVTLLHVLADEEVSPSLDEDGVELFDVEEPRARLAVDAGALEAYRRALDGFTRRLETFCASHRMLYLRAVSSTPFDSLVAQGLQSGMWQPRG